MGFLKRIFLFLLTNLLVVITISIVLNVLGVRPYLTSHGIDYGALLVFCFVWGMTGAFISLQMSRWVAKFSMGISVIDPNNPGQLAWLVQMVSQEAQAAGLPRTPEIGIFDSSELNAFATGPSKRRSLIAFSSGILSAMSKEDLQGVAGHELTHVANGDMVTMTLLQGVINAFVLFLSKAIAFALTMSGNNDDRRPGFSTFLMEILLQILFSALGMVVVCWFSRWREFRADAGGARIAGRQKMIHALQTLEQAFGQPQLAPQGATSSMSPYKISGSTGRFFGLFATHPPLEARVAALQSLPA